MKSVYVKTQWIDNKTPVNAANLNKIENALHTLYSNSLGYSDIKEGEGIKVEVTADKEVKISTSPQVLKSSNISGIDFILEGEENDNTTCGCNCTCCDIPTEEKGILYFVLDPSTKKLKSIKINGVKIYEVE